MRNQEDIYLQMFQYTVYLLSFYCYSWLCADVNFHLESTNGLVCIIHERWGFFFKHNVHTHSTYDSLLLFWSFVVWGERGVYFLLLLSPSYSQRPSQLIYIVWLVLLYSNFHNKHFSTLSKPQFVTNLYAYNNCSHITGWSL